jgi:hypothetical protein
VLARLLAALTLAAAVPLLSNARWGEGLRRASRRSQRQNSLLATWSLIRIIGMKHLTPNTLEKWRVQGGGPPYRKHGRYVRYHLEDLIAWSEAQKRRSTSDEP